MAEERGWFEPDGARQAVTEPTQMLPTVPRPAPVVVARAVIVYEERPRRPWRLWVFSVAIVALTIGVVLGQTVAFEPVYRPAQAIAGPTDVIPPAPSISSAPAPPSRLTAPLGAVRTRVLEVAGSAAALHVRSADLGATLFDIATTGPGAAPRLTDSDRGTRLELTGTGAEIQLNAEVAWTLRLTGGSPEHTVDMRAGGVAGLEVSGGTGRVELWLPAPKGTTRLSVTGPVGELVVRTPAGTPVRLKLDDGATSATIDGRTRRKVKAGTTLTPPGWSTAKNRYDLVTSGSVGTIRSGE